MDSVPARFIESVLQISPWPRSLDPTRKLPGRWGQLEEVYSKKRGVLHLTYRARDRNEGSFKYRLNGFAHIKTRTLSREVVKEMSKSIQEIHCFVLPSMRFGFYEETDLEEDDDTWELLLRLEAPVKILMFHTSYELDSKKASVSKSFQLFRTFTSLDMNSIDQAPVQLMEDILSSGRLQSITIREPVPATLPASAWVDCFFSESCSTLSVNFQDSAVIPKILEQWKKTDSRALASHKIIETPSIPDASVIGMTTIQMESAESAEVIKKVESKIAGRINIRSLHLIDHPVDPSSKIYVVLQVCGGYVMWFD
uniref:FBA_2 domain-containing protein n=1 Tax=Steinernema glaseri TaxID=37863 RepID=A0A1I7YSZ2_9BILA